MCQTIFELHLLLSVARVMMEVEAASDGRVPSAPTLVHLFSQEGEMHVVPIEAAMSSELIKSMIDVNAPSSELHELPMPNVRSQTLVKVIDFMNHYLVQKMESIPRPLTSSNIRDLVNDWYVQYISIPQDELYDLILAANFMDIRPLLDLGCAYVATMIKDKSMQQIKTTFNVVNDMTPEQERILREDPKYKWAEEE